MRDDTNGKNNSHLKYPECSHINFQDLFDNFVCPTVWASEKVNNNKKSPP